MELKEEYPALTNSLVRKEYTEKINKIFEDNNFNWIAGSAIISPNIFVKPKKYNYEQLNTETLPFKDIIKIAINTKNGDARLGLIAYPSMNNSPVRLSLEKAGYSYEPIEGQTWLYFLVKPLNKLEEVVKELKNLESILLTKDL